MRRLLVTVLALVLVALGACTSSSATGVVAPRSASELSTHSAVEEAALRGAALAFLEAYAAVQEEGTAQLEALVDGSYMQTWVHWLGVQRDEFEGTGVSTLTVSDIGPSSESAANDPSVPVRVVDLIGGLSFDLDPDRDDPIPTFERPVDGPMALVRQQPGYWTVVNFTRDGAPLSLQFQPVTEGAQVEVDGTTVRLAAAFVLPTWEFGLSVDAGDEDTGIRSARLVTADGVIDDAGVITASIATVPAGETGEGLVVFERQDSTAGVSLQLVLAPSGRTIDIALEGVVASIEEAAGQALA